MTTSFTQPDLRSQEEEEPWDEMPEERENSGGFAAFSFLQPVFRSIHDGFSDLYGGIGNTMWQA